MSQLLMLWDFAILDMIVRQCQYTCSGIAHNVAEQHQEVDGGFGSQQ